MKWTLLTLFVIALLPVSLFSQSLSVSKFRLLDTDLTAISNSTQEIDQNGEVAALIKVVTSENGFTFDTGAIGIVSVRQGVGEIWVYVPKRAQKISIFHQEFGVIRNYYFPMPIEGGRTYELVLNVVKEKKVTEEVPAGRGAAVSNDENAYWANRGLAEAGDASAQYYVGYCFENGKGVSADEREAVEWYKKSASQGNTRAQLSLGRCYEKGKGVEVDEKEAFGWYMKAAEQGNTEAQCEVAKCYYYGKLTKQNYDEAFKWFKKIKTVEGQDVDFMLVVGDMYYYGRGVKSDYNVAAKWYGGAYERVDAEIALDLADRLLNAKGEKKDVEEALKWYERAAECGNFKAMVYLGELYNKGKVVKQDLEKYKTLMERADTVTITDNGNAESYISLAVFYLSGKVVDINPEKALAWLNKALQFDSIEANLIMGYCYEKGLGLKKDQEKADRWYNRALTKNSGFVEIKDLNLKITAAGLNR